MAKQSHPLFSSIASSPVTAVNTSKILEEMRNAEMRPLPLC